MSIFFTILILMLLVSLSQVIVRIVPFQVPLPLIQIVIGVLLAWPDILHVDFDQELFMVLFIPPLLFYDGKKISLPEFAQQIREVVGLALILVMLTIVTIGYLTHFLIPQISLPIAFALAAVLSPTDAVALSGIVGDGRIAKNKFSIIEGEALMNDASGLVAFKFAIFIALGAMTFSVLEISLGFIKVAGGGLLIGFLISWLYSNLQRVMLLWGYDDSPAQILFILLLPFAAYLTAEFFDFSGILATVSAGMTVTYKKISYKTSISTRLQSQNIWSMLTYVFNGMIFIMLGLQIPELLKHAVTSAREATWIEHWQLILFIVIIYCSLILMRFVWFWVMRLLSKTSLLKRPLLFINYTARDMWISSIAGVRGAITLAGILSLPLYIDTPNNLMPLNERYILISIAASIILISLVVAAIALPLLLGKNTIDKSEELHQEHQAKKQMAEQAVKTLTKIKPYLKKNNAIEIPEPLFDEVCLRVINTFKYSSYSDTNEEINVQLDNLERRLRLIALNAERATLYQLRAKKQVNHEVMEKLLYDLDLLESVLSTKK